jgi:ribose transport system substrate-binding protein
MKIIAIVFSILGFYSSAVVSCNNTSPTVKNTIEIKGSDQQPRLKSIEVSLGNLGNTLFLAMVKGVEIEAEEIVCDDAQLTVVSSLFDLNQQFNQIENFIAANTDVIVDGDINYKRIVSAVDQAILASQVVITVDTKVNTTVSSNNLQFASRKGCLSIYCRSP